MKALGKTHIQLLSSADAYGNIHLHNKKFQTNNALDTLIKLGFVVNDIRPYKNNEAWCGFWITDAGRNIIPAMDTEDDE